MHAFVFSNSFQMCFTLAILKRACAWQAVPFDLPQYTHDAHMLSCVNESKRA